MSPSNQRNNHKLTATIITAHRVNSVALHTILPITHHRLYPMIITRLGHRYRQGVQFLDQELIGNPCHCQTYLQVDHEVMRDHKRHLLLFLSNRVATPYSFMVSLYNTMCHHFFNFEYVFNSEGPLRLLGYYRRRI